MDGDEIEIILNEDNNVIGFKTTDELPSIPTSCPKYIMINTANSDMEGEHWIALVMYNKRFLKKIVFI